MGLGVAFPHLVAPSHEGGLDTLGVRRRDDLCVLGGPRPAACAIGPLAQLNHEGGLAVTSLVEQKTYCKMQDDFGDPPAALRS